jgi:GcrA cell cycle regulator
MRMHWTEEQDQYLREHRGKLSSSQIGAQLGCTRNAVIGRSNRLGLERLRSYNTFEEINHGKRVKAAAKVAKEGAVRPATVNLVALPPPSIDDAAIPAEQRKSTLDLGPHDCRWPVGDPQEPGFFFCGAVQRDGSSYCAAHHHIAHNRIRESVNARPKFNFVVTTQVLETSADAA